MELIVENLTNGKYRLEPHGYLYFEIYGANNECLFLVDKKSALEIAHTLIDSLDMLDKDTEDLICRMQEKIDN